MSVYYYFDVSLNNYSSKEDLLDEYKLRQIILQGLKTLFGEDGSTIQVDILKFIVEEKRAILRCLCDFYVKVRASLSLVSEYNDIKYSFHVNKVAASLLALQSDSRSYNFD